MKNAIWEILRAILWTAGAMVLWYVIWFGVGPLVYGDCLEGYQQPLYDVLAGKYSIGLFILSIFGVCGASFYKKHRSISITLFIVGALIALLLSSIPSVQVQSRNARRMSDLRQVQNALELYHNQYNIYPVSLSELTAVVRQIPQDPTTNQFYNYGLSDDKQSYVLGAQFTDLCRFGATMLDDPSEIDGAVYGVDCDDTRAMYCIKY